MYTIMYDFDGTLVDSYSCLPAVYMKLAYEFGIDNRVLFVESMLMFEDLMDYYGIWDHRIWWDFLSKNSTVFKNIDRDKLIDRYWFLRIKYSKFMDKVLEVLDKLKNMDFDLYIVSGTDDTVERKIDRIKKSGLDKYFEDMIIYGPGSDFKNINDAIEYVINNTTSGKYFYIDDKVINLNKLIDTGTVLIRYYFRPPFPRAFAWTSSSIREYIVIYTHTELVRFLEKLLGIAD